MNRTAMNPKREGRTAELLKRQAPPSPGKILAVLGDNEARHQYLQ